MAQKEHEMRYKLSAEASSFTSAFKEAQSTLTETQQRIQQLASEQADISAYQRQQEAIQRTTEKLELLESQYNNYQREMDETGTFSAKLANSQDKVFQNITKTESALEQQTAQLNQMGDALREAGIDVDNLGTESEELYNEMMQLRQQEEEAAQATEEVGDEAEAAAKDLDDVGNSADEAGDQSQSFGDRASEAISGVSQLLVSAGIANKLKEIYEAFMECADASASFQAAMSNVEALSGASTTQMEQLTSTAKTLGATTKFTAEESATAMGYMAMAGWDANQMLAGINGTMSLAAASGEDLAVVSDIVTDSMTAFGLQASDAGRYADILAATATNSNTNVSMLGETFKYVAPLAGALAYDVEDVAVATGIMANAGIKGSEAGTTLRNILTRLAKPTSESADAMQALGISLTDDSGRMLSFMEILEAMRDSFAGLTEEEQTFYAAELAGQRGMSGLLSIVNASESDFANLSAAISECSGAAERMADIKVDNLQGQLVLLQSAWDGVKIAIGDSLSPVLEGVYGLLEDLLGEVTEFINANPQVVAGVAAFAGVLGAAVAGLTAFAGAMALASAAGVTLATVVPVLGGIVAVAAAIGVAASEIYKISQASESATEALERVSGQIEALQSNASLVSQYQALTEEMSSTALSADELAEKQAQLDTVTAALRDTYPELLGELEAGTQAWDLQVEAIQAMIDAEEAANQVELAANVTEALEDLRRLEEGYRDAVEAHEDLQEQMSNSIDFDAQGAIDNIEALRDSLAEGLSAGTIEFGDDTFNAQIAEIKTNLESLTGTTVEIGGLSDVDYWLSQVSADSYNAANSASHWASENAAAAQNVASSYAELSAVQKSFITLLDSGLYSMDDLRTMAGDTSLSLSDLGLTIDDVGAMVANGSLTVGEAAARYGVYEQDVRMAAEGYAAAQREANEAAEAGADALDTIADASERSYREQLQLEFASQAVAEGWMDAEQAASMYGISVEDLTDYVQEAEDKQSALDAALAVVSEGFMTAEQAAERFGLSVNEIRTEQFENALQNLINKYGEVYTAAYDSLSKQFDLWDKAADVTSTSMSTLQSNLESQVKYWQDYNTNLSTVAQAAQTAGVDISGIWDSLSSGNADAVNAVAGMASEIASSSDGGASALQTYVDTYNTLQDAMGETAQTIAENNSEVQEAFSEFNEILQTGAEDANMAEEFGQSASDTLQGYLDAWQGGQGAIGDQMAADAQAWLDALNAALGVHSPSTITNQSGVDTIQGFVNGVDATAPSASAAMQNAANSAINAFKALMNASTLYSAGAAAIQGAISGINSMIPQLVAAARRAGEQASAAYKEAQDIHSPSKVFEEFGQMDILGAIKGIENMQETADAAFRSAAEEHAQAYMSAYDAMNFDELNAIAFGEALHDSLNDRYMSATSGGVSAWRSDAEDEEPEIVINFAPEFNLEGVKDEEQVQQVLDVYTDELRRWVQDVVRDSAHEARRRAYA